MIFPPFINDSYNHYPIRFPDIIDTGYAQTFEEAYERIENLYREERAEDDNPPVEDFLVWRDLRAFDGKVSSTA